MRFMNIVLLLVKGKLLNNWITTIKIKTVPPVKGYISQLHKPIKDITAYNCNIKLL